jgi:hypothetical protein
MLVDVARMQFFDPETGERIADRAAPEAVADAGTAAGAPADGDGDAEVEAGV